MPSVVFSNTFNWDCGASITETVVDDDPSHPGQFAWNFHVDHADGMSTFVLPVEDPALITDEGSTTSGWTVSPGALGDPNLVLWQGPAMGVNGFADFWLTTAPTDYAFSNGVLSNINLPNLNLANLNTSPGGLLAIPIAAPIPPGAQPNTKAIEVVTDLDEAAENTGLTSLRLAIQQQEAKNLPNQPLEIRFVKQQQQQIVVISLYKELEIKKNIFINGEDRLLTLQRDPLAQDDFRLIKGLAGSKLAISGLTLTKGKAPETADGGAIRTDGDLTLTDCTILENSATNGGGVYCAGDLMVSDCNFVRNTAVTHGGGIYAAKGSVNIVYSLITANKTESPTSQQEGNGGGIYLGNGVTGADIIYTTIRDNTAEYEGGGVFVSGGAEGVVTWVELLVCDIFGNKAKTSGNSANGGGVAAAGGELHIDQTNIYSNWALASPQGTCYGGGVYLGAGVSSATFTNSTICTNNAQTSGGGLWIEIPLQGFSNTVTLSGTVVFGNSAASQGGGIGVETPPDSNVGTVGLTLANGTSIIDNSLTKPASRGGGLYLGWGPCSSMASRSRPTRPAKQPVSSPRLEPL